MEKKNTNNDAQNKNAVPHSTAANVHSNMPVKTPATDTKKNTAKDVGLNQAVTEKNDIDPGTTPPGDE